MQQWVCQASYVPIAPARDWGRTSLRRIMQLEGVHHVTCITRDARRNVDFYTRVLGLRMVAKTVNQDDPFFYHLFYGDEEGRPGAEITFFEYPRAKAGRAGPGMIHRVIWRVGSTVALDFWAARLAAEGIATEQDEQHLRFADPEGLGLELAIFLECDEPLIANHPEIPRQAAIRGLEGVRAYTIDPESSRPILEKVLEGTPIDACLWELRGKRRGGTIAYDPAPEGRGIQGAGTVHHVAWGTTISEHPKWYERLQQAGIHSTPIVDRHFFHSIYFREPSGVLFELADDGPGFARDVPVQELGSTLVLPPFLEPRRAEVASHLSPLPDPRGTWRHPLTG